LGAKEFSSSFLKCQRPFRANTATHEKPGILKFRGKKRGVYKREGKKTKAKS
jgi:hypothetical protein